MNTKEIMKASRSILVLTDFSRSAKIAADYAAHLAEQLNATLLIFNSYLIPDLGFDSWPSGDHSSLLQQSQNNLELEVARLYCVLQDQEKETQVKIESISDEGAIAENVCAIIKEKQNVLMVVMGGCKATGSDNILLGIEVTEVLNKVKCPTLIVPETGCIPF
jgi:nucleotide-binding universal stress UspA family protein